MRDPPILVALRKRVEEWMAIHGYRKEKKPFRPHKGNRKTIRRTRRVKYSVLAEAAGVNHSVISRFMRGGALKVDMAQRIANAVGRKLVLQNKSHTEPNCLVEKKSE